MGYKSKYLFIYTEKLTIERVKLRMRSHLHLGTEIKRTKN